MSYSGPRLDHCADIIVDFCFVGIFSLVGIHPKRNKQQPPPPPPPSPSLHHPFQTKQRIKAQDDISRRGLRFLFVCCFLAVVFCCFLFVCLFFLGGGGGGAVVFTSAVLIILLLLLITIAVIMLVGCVADYEENPKEARFSTLLSPDSMVWWLGVRLECRTSGDHCPVGSHRWLQNWHSSGYHAWRLV